eukprot:1311776-Pleurochrysis_carterae.AAC.2
MRVDVPRASTVHHERHVLSATAACMAAHIATLRRPTKSARAVAAGPRATAGARWDGATGDAAEAKSVSGTFVSQKRMKAADMPRRAACAMR